MSYEKVRSVRFFSDDNIILESVSNNVSPKKYHKWKFTGTLIDFLRYVQGNELQIATSANGYFWGACFPIFKKSLDACNIDFENLYYLDSSNQRWDDIVKIFKVVMKKLQDDKKQKFYLKDGMFYIGGRAYGNKYFLVQYREDAKKYPCWQARYMSETYGWNMENVR